MIPRTLRSYLVPVLLTVACLTPSLWARADETWRPDLTAALEEARREGKDLLVDFTGSDWCSPCMRLDKEVFSRSEFREAMDEDFVLVALDFPKEGGKTYRAMPAELHARNQRESEVLGVDSFPTVLLMTADGVAYARTGYRPGGAVAYTQHIEELRSEGFREETQEQLEALRSDEPQKRLAAAYALLGRSASQLEQEVIEVIQRDDLDDSRGVLGNRALDAFLETHLSTQTPDWDAVWATFDGLAEQQPSVTRLGRYHWFRGLVALKTGRVDAARQSLERAAEGGDVERRALEWLEQEIDGLASGAG